MLLLPAACTLDPIRETPRDALTDFPGKVHPNNHDSVRILQQRTVTDGVVLFYRWQTDAAAAAETFCAASAFVTYGASGWQAQSGGYFVGDTVSQPAADVTLAFVVLRPGTLPNCMGVWRWTTRQH